MPAEYAKDVLAEPDWLERHLDDEGIRIVEVDEDPTAYLGCHIPGAVGLDWGQDLQDPLRRRFLGAEEFGELLGRHGVSNEHLVILYGDRNNWFAAYAYWYLKYYGHERMKLLNGPRERWISEGRPTSTQPSRHAPATFLARPGDDAIRARREDVLRALGGSCVLVDVRSTPEYTGRLATPVSYEGAQPQRAGRIPGAKSIPWARAVNEDGSFKSAEELRQLYLRGGVLGGSPIISYCRVGERAALTWFVLHELLGEENVRNYDGSWTEWGSLVEVPIERGEAQA